MTGEGSNFAKSKPSIHSVPQAGIELESTSESLDPSAAKKLEDDESLYLDLLRKARGDEKLAKQWMARMGSDTSRRDRESEVPVRDLDTAAAEAGAPRTFFCPISFRIFRDPVMLETGQTYERRYIERWMAQGNFTCPVTRQVIVQPAVLTPNVALRKSIEEWAESHATWLLTSDGSLKSIPEEDDFASVRTPPEHDADLALAIRLQQEEVNRASQPPRTRHMRSSFRRVSAVQEVGILHQATLMLYLLTAVNVAYFIISIWQNEWGFENLDQNPLVGASGATLRKIGAKDSSAIMVNHQFWRLASSIFIPAGLIHLFFVTTSLWTFGKYLERVLAVPILSVGFVYVVSGFAGAITSANLVIPYNAVGASAGICGLLGGVWADQFINWKAYVNHYATFAVLAFVTAVHAALGLLPFIDNFFHAAAFGCGALLCTVFIVHKRADSGPGRYWGLLQLGCCILVVAGVAVGIKELATASNVSRECDWCNEVACVNTRWWHCTPTHLQTAPACSFIPFNNGTARFDCPGPQGGSSFVNITAGLPDAASQATLCLQTCGTGSPPTRSTSPSLAAPGASTTPATNPSTGLLI